MGYTLKLVEQEPFDRARQDRLLASTVEALGELCEVLRCLPPDEDDDCDEGTHLVGVNINGPDPRRAFAGLVAFARGRRLSLFDSQADGLVDLDAPGELPRLFAGEAEGVTPARLMWASELEPRLRGESEVPSGGGSD